MRESDQTSPCTWSETLFWYTVHDVKMRGLNSMAVVFSLPELLSIYSGLR